MSGVTCSSVGCYGQHPHRDTFLLLCSESSRATPYTAPQVESSENCGEHLSFASFPVRVCMLHVAS